MGLAEPPGGSPCLRVHDPTGIPGRDPGGHLPRILTDLSRTAIVAALEQNCIDYFMRFGHGPGCEAHEDPGVTWFATGVADPLFNGVMTAHLAREDVDHRVDELLAEFRSRRLPLEWTVGASTVPQDLGTRLRAKGLTHLLEVPGMAMDLAKLPEEPLPDGLTIEAADRPEDIEACVRIGAATFQIADAFVPRLVEIELGMPAEHREATVAFVGRFRGKATASSVLFLSAGVAGVYFVGTLAAARGRGIGRAMTTWALRMARDRGYRLGTLQATEMGLPVYRRLGFEAYSRFEIYT